VMLRVFRAYSQSDFDGNSYSILSALESSGAREGSLLLVVKDGSLGFNLRGAECNAAVSVPQAQWVRVAFVYNGELQQQLIFQDDRLVATCKVPPLFAAGHDENAEAWLGKHGPA
ncbi:unnamed protein product, partial [Polarella glacialis]